MNGLFSFLAVVNNLQISLKPEVIFSVGGIQITNAIFYGFFTSIFAAWLMIYLARKSTVKAKKGAVAVYEILVEFMISTMEGTFGTRKKAIKYTPIFASFFFFILITNMLEMLPIVGPGLTSGGFPLFRPFTADYNGTLAMAIIAIVIVQVLSIKAQGVKGHLKHYFTDKPLNPINMFVGLLEIFSELIRILSLSLRLFLNTLVGDILIIVFNNLVIGGGRTPLVVIPIFLFEALVAGIQAYVFTVLSATYLALAISHTQDEDDHEEVALKVEGANT